MIEKFDEIEKKYRELTERLSDPAVMSDQATYQKLAKSHAEMSELVEKFVAYKKVLAEKQQAEEMLKETTDKDLKELAEAELQSLGARQEILEKEIRQLLLPKDPRDGKNIILEIRAGTGGEEAALFVADLLRMYTRYAEKAGWRVEILSSNPTGIGGFKEVILGISGKDVYSRLKYESGVHRVQRVPVTEASGRIHTSAVTVAVLPEAEEVDVTINPSDLRIDTYCSSGPGGQSVNTTYSAVRITHLPTGMIVTCQDERSQIKNKAKAMKVLRSRLLEQIQKEQTDQISQDRRSQVGTGDRSERIRTYNFPQSRVTDHRINLTLYNLPTVMEGELDAIIGALVEEDQRQKLAGVA